jgi:hypothetical protein
VLPRQVTSSSAGPSKISLRRGDPDRDTIDLAILDAVTAECTPNAFPQKRVSQAERVTGLASC